MAWLSDKWKKLKARCGRTYKRLIEKRDRFKKQHGNWYKFFKILLWAGVLTAAAISGLWFVHLFWLGKLSFAHAAAIVWTKETTEWHVIWGSYLGLLGSKEIYDRCCHTFDDKQTAGVNASSTPVSPQLSPPSQTSSPRSRSQTSRLHTPEKSPKKSGSIKTTPAFVTPSPNKRKKQTSMSNSHRFFDYTDSGQPRTKTSRRRKITSPKTLNQQLAETKQEAKQIIEQINTIKKPGRRLSTPKKAIQAIKTVGYRNKLRSSTKQANQLDKHELYQDDGSLTATHVLLQRIIQTSVIETAWPSNIDSDLESQLIEYQWRLGKLKSFKINLLHDSKLRKFTREFDFKKHQKNSQSVRKLVF